MAEEASTRDILSKQLDAHQLYADVSLDIVYVDKLEAGCLEAFYHEL